MPTSRGAGVAKKGYDYAIYAEGGEVDREPKRAAKEGKVAKYAKGGSCRGMGAAVKGGKYTIK